MKNLFHTILTIILITSFSQPIYSQNVSDVTRDRGLVMQRDESQGIVNFHRRADDDFDFMYMRATDTSSLNNVVLTDGGMMLIGVDDLCGGLVALPPTMPNVKLFVDGGFDVAKYGSGLWSVVSDERLKTDIQPLENSLDLLKEINFFDYEYNGLAQTPNDGQRYFGVMAQQVRRVLPTTVSHYQQKLQPTDSKPSNLLMFDPNDLFYTGLNAIKELAEKTEALEKTQTKNEVLEERMEALENQMTQLMDALNQQISPVEPEQQFEKTNTNTQNTFHIGAAQLFQNAPNPLHHETKIRYYLPQNTVGGDITIQDLNGKMLQQFPLKNRGEGEVTFNARQNGLIGGTYVYTLRVNGQVIDSKKMIFTE